MRFITGSAMYLVLVLLLTLQDGAFGIVLTKISVPETKVVGDNVDLNCEWEKEDDHVYTLKWYLGLHEFYRWTPAELQDKKSFPLPSAFHIDLLHSSQGQVRITNVSLAASGNYRCEISGEAPFFKTSFKTSTMTVIDLPDAQPQITGVKRSYRLRDVVDVNCTSFNAKPVPELTFYVDNDLADPDWIMKYPEVVSNNGLKNITLGLKFEISPSIPKSDKIHIKCTAAHPHIYWESSNEYVKIDLPHFYPVTGKFPPEDGDVTDSGATHLTSSRTMKSMALLMCVCVTSYVR